MTEQQFGRRHFLTGWLERMTAVTSESENIDRILKQETDRSYLGTEQVQNEKT